MALALPGAPGAYGALNGYWGQVPGPRLRDYCDSGVQYATLGFVNMSPENDRSGAGYPDINFSGHCYLSSNATQLYRDCPTIREDIPYCQSKGVKVLLSIGGDYKKPKDRKDLVSNDYMVTTEANGEEFANFLYKAFGPYRHGYDGPRPFDGPKGHVAVDGFDFDIEINPAPSNDPYIAMINKLRALDRNLLITGAPQCPTDAGNFLMKGMIQKAAFDALFIQFYNNPRCNANSKGGINLDDWIKVVSESEKSQNAKLFVGLFAAKEVKRGYISPKQVKDLVCKYKDSKNWGGISLWDLNLAAANVVDGKGYHQHVQDALKSGCPEPTSASAYPGPTSASTPVSASGSAIKSPSASGSVSAITSMPTLPASSLKWSNSTVAVPMTTRTVYTTVVRTVVNCPPEVVNCLGTAHLVTETISLYTTVCPATPTSQSATPTATQTSVALTTSTVYATRTHTITSCAPGVVDCHRGEVTTETVSLYTTVCPVTPTAHPEKPAKTGASLPATTPTESSRSRVTSTLYATKTHTVTSCPPGVSKCLHGEVITQVISRVSTAGPEGTVPAVVAPASSTLERLPKPSPVSLESGHKCNGTGCPAGSGVPRVPGNGCPGVNCTAGAGVPVTAGASGLALSLTGLVVVLATLVLAL